MSDQFCKVGTVTPITSGTNAIDILEYRYRNFMEKAMDATYMNTKLGEFFNRKAEELRHILDSLS
ncbi:hypothetical protein [Flagellimonas meishanensis]|uniref:hypothetical protein n=1 Tax=Flagellimonas meishanensis TaxID=2873264 RepID=UPI001CA7AF51|nr:hypothetical protein [[Muricauda] meishanensis]